MDETTKLPIFQHDREILDELKKFVDLKEELEEKDEKKEEKKDKLQQYTWEYLVIALLSALILFYCIKFFRDPKLDTFAYFAIGLIAFSALIHLVFSLYMYFKK